MLKNPIEIHIYDEDNQNVKETYRLMIIPWGVTKKLIGVVSKMDDKASDEEALEKISPLLCDAFQGKFDETTLDLHGDTDEVISAIRSMMEEVEAKNPNAVKEPQKKTAPKSTIPNGGAVSN